jgi:hypothetical protein
MISIRCQFIGQRSLTTMIAPFKSLKTSLTPTCIAAFAVERKAFRCLVRALAINRDHLACVLGLGTDRFSFMFSRCFKSNKDIPRSLSPEAMAPATFLGHDHHPRPSSIRRMFCPDRESANSWAAHQLSIAYQKHTQGVAGVTSQGCIGRVAGNPPGMILLPIDVQEVVGDKVVTDLTMWSSLHTMVSRFTTTLTNSSSESHP